MKHIGHATGLALTGLLLSSVAVWAGPKVVSGPGANAGCFKPWSDKTKFFQWDKQAGPYKIALVNGFVGNTWRIQMVKTAKAFAEQPGIKENIKEFKVVSTGTDVAAQLGAMEDFINQGVQAIVDHRGRAGRVRSHHPPRRQEQCRRGSVRQHPRHRQGDDGQRGPEGNGPHVGALAHRAVGQDRRRHPRGARAAGQLGRSRPACRLPRGDGSGAQQVQHHRSRRQLGHRHLAEGHRRRLGGPRPFRRACSRKAAPTAPCRR